jgi:hypothetical protein
MKNLRSLFSFALVMVLFTGTMFTSCGGKKDAAEETEQTEVSEHPADADSNEHPADADSTENPAEEGAEHPADN